MTRKEFAQQLSEKMPDKKPKEIVDMLAIMFQEIEKGLMDNRHILIRGLGTFYLNEIKGYTGTDPRNGNPVVIDKAYHPWFKPSARLVVK